MLDSFDYKEPNCKLCGGKDFYYPKENAPLGRIPVSRIIAKLDECYNKNDNTEAKRLLEYWQNEALSLKDFQGELSIINELLGQYRKLNDDKKGLWAVDRANQLIDLLDAKNNFSSATIYLNMATTLKAFNQPEKALAFFEKCFLIYSNNPEKSKPLLSGYYNNKALALCDLKRFDEAEEHFKLALTHLKGLDNELVDGAITFVNLAHLYYAQNKKSEITDSLFSAYNLLNDEKVDKNGYYAFVLSKCAPSFRQFGYEKIALEFEQLSKEIYERTWFST